MFALVGYCTGRAFLLEFSGFGVELFVLRFSLGLVGIFLKTCGLFVVVGLCLFVFQFNFRLVAV